MFHVPLVRAGNPYRSLSTVILRDFRNNEPVAEISQANPGLIAKDIGETHHGRRALQAISIAELLTICRKAANHFAQSALAVGEEAQSPDAYIQYLSSTTGMPEVLCRKNMTKIQGALENMEQVLSGLTRGLPLSLLDKGWDTQEDRSLSYSCETETLGAILPNNSPGVHSLWLSAIPLKVPVTLKPGREEPWTPLRIVQSFLAAGCPPEALGFYPTDYSGATEILLRCGRSMLFGDESTVAPWRQDRRIQIHGPGWSKILIGEDKIHDWEKYIDLMVASVVENAGRSCINASGIWVSSHGREIAEALARRLSRIEAKGMEDPNAQLAAFPNRKVAKSLNDLIDSHLRNKDATDMTAPLRNGKRLAEHEGGTFLLPTVVWCENPAHPLANTELLFPFVSVVQVPRMELLSRMGHTLVLTAITEDEALIQELLSSPQIERLNLGLIPTNQIAWDQPHEGNLFEHLYRQRAFQRV